MRVLVTGVTGFIGRHVAKALQGQGHDVRGLVRPASSAPEGVEAVVGDVTVPGSLPAALLEVDAVVHLAGVTQATRPVLYERVNTEGTVHLARACVDAGVPHLVYASSLSAQGPSAPGVPHVDPGDEAPINDYGRSKLAAERWLADIAGLSVTVLRPCVVYGPGDRELLAWSRLVRRRLVPTVQDLELSFVHVDDLARLVSDLVTRQIAPFGPFFISDGQPAHMMTVLDMVERVLAGPPTVRFPMPTRALRRLTPAVERFASATGVGLLAARTVRELAAPAWACSPQRAREALGFEPRVRLEQGLPATFAWYREAGWV